MGWFEKLKKAGTTAVNTQKFLQKHVDSDAVLGLGPRKKGKKDNFMDQF